MKPTGMEMSVLFRIFFSWSSVSLHQMVVKENILDRIEEMAKEEATSQEKVKAARTVKNLFDLTNQTVGDALSNMLLVESVLRKKCWTFTQWAECYTDLPSKQVKVKVVDRSVIKTTWDEGRVTEPLALQIEIDKLLLKNVNSRAFVRPSGTEDIVRVYAEAETQEITDWLAREIEIKVYDLAGGIGNRPKKLNV
eukprot:m.22900 g.22900  ORF g.22900 m.22900 type:complete len:195 (+) comp28419_c0_seq8:1-585(+)